MLHADDYKHYVDAFNAADVEMSVNLIPNAAAWDWMSENVPLFACPDETIERIYYYRWWTFRKHVKQTPKGIIITEFIEPVRHAGTYNSISCALGHHLAEGRWIRDGRILDEYTRFWFRGGEDGGPEYRFHRYSQWTAAAMLDRARVAGDDALLLDLLPDLIADYAKWEQEKRRPDGLFWQFDVWDGMEESISGSRIHKNARPTINSYMYANALAIAEIATMARRPDVAESFRTKAAELKSLTQEALWDARVKFFKAQAEEGPLSDAREAIGFIPWCFNLPDPGREDAWAQFIDPQGFWAPMGLTTAERRHPRFRSHGVGKCEWDGAVWPFATSQTLVALANVLRHYDQRHVTKRHYLDAMHVYALAHQRDGEPYIGEYHDEVTGEWLKGDNQRSRCYNHSTFADLVIAGLVGLCPRGDSTIDVHPLLPADTWDWFCVDNVPYHGRTLTIAWDRTGAKYGRGPGLSIAIGGRRVATSPDLGPLRAELN
ncbi:MAG: glycosyl hydrolase family 65 protein [Tepidisphaeraceae bacterium]